MDLVIDANIIISALISPKSYIYDIIFNDKVNLYALEFLLEEFNKHKEEILLKSELSRDEFYIFLALIGSKIRFVSFSDFKEFIPKAKEISHDPNDIEYFALTLKLNCSIWSEDKDFKRQFKVKVFLTSELIKGI